jgi:hypothetical protein
MGLVIVLLAVVVVLLLVVRPVHAGTAAVTAFSDMPSDSVITFMHVDPPMYSWTEWNNFLAESNIYPGHAGLAGGR